MPSTGSVHPAWQWRAAVPGGHPPSGASRKPVVLGYHVLEGGGETTVLFACVHNAGRSQMAAALFNRLADPARSRAISAGTEPGDRVHPVVVEALAERGIDLSETRPRLLTPDLAAGCSLLVTMGCGERCPVVPGVDREDWPLEDPKDRPIEEVRVILAEIERRVAALVARHGWGR